MQHDTPLPPIPLEAFSSKLLFVKNAKGQIVPFCMVHSFGDTISEMDHTVVCIWWDYDRGDEVETRNEAVFFCPDFATARLLIRDFSPESAQLMVDNERVPQVVESEG